MSPMLAATLFSHFTPMLAAATLLLILNKSSMEHIPRAQPRSGMLLDSCLYVLSMKILQEVKGSAVLL